MSNAVGFEGKDEIAGLVKDIRNDETDNNWLFLDYTDDKYAKLKLAGSGAGGVEEFVGNLGDIKAGYGLLRVAEDIDDTSSATKFVAIQWLDESVKSFGRARVTTHKGAIEALFGALHVYIPTGNKDELTLGGILKRLKEVSGAAGTGGAKAGARHQALKRKSFIASQGVRFVDKDAVDNAVKDVRSDQTEADYLVLGYEDAVTDNLVVLGTGTGGFDAMFALMKPEGVMYGLLRTVEEIDGNKVARFVGIYWIGENVQIFRKARVATHKGALQSAFGPIHVELTVEKEAELSLDIVNQKITDTSGTHSRVKQVKEEEQTETNTPAPEKPPAPSLGTGSTGWTRRPSGPQVSRRLSQGSFVPKSSTGLKLEDEAGIKEAIKSIRSLDSENDYVLLEYQDPTTLKLAAVAGGGINSLKEKLTADAVLYALLRRADEVDGHKHTKFAVLIWLGPQVSFAKRAKVTPQKGSVTELFSPYHVDITLTSTEDLTEEELESKIKAARGR